MSIDSPDWVRQITAKTEEADALEVTIAGAGGTIEPIYDEKYKEATSNGTQYLYLPWHLLGSLYVPEGETWYIDHVLYRNDDYQGNVLEWHIVSHPDYWDLGDKEIHRVIQPLEYTSYWLPFRLTLFQGQKLKTRSSALTGNYLNLCFWGTKSIS